MFSCDIKFIIATVRPKNKTLKTIKNGLLIDKISQVHKYTRNHETSYSRNLSAMYGCLEQTSNQHLSIVDTSNQYGRIPEFFLTYLTSRDYIINVIIIIY